MNDIRKRHLLFVFGCIPTRLLLTYIVEKVDIHYLPYLGFFSIFPSIGFIVLYLTNGRKKGLETFGEPIWWNELRVIHGILYLLFTIYAFKKKRRFASISLLLDVSIGFISFFIYHYFMYQ